MDIQQHDDNDRPDMARPRRTWLALIVLVGLLVAVIAGVSLIGPSDQQPPDGQLGVDPLGSVVPDKPWVPALTTPDNNTLPPSSRPSVEILYTVDESLPPEERMEAMKQEAVAMTDRLTQEFPRQTNTLAVAALVLNRYGRYDQAAERWNACLDLDPRFVDAYSGLGAIALKQGNYSRSEAMLKKALRVNPQLQECRYELARAMMNQGKMAEAAVVLQEDIDTSGETAQTRWRLGQAFSHLEEHEKAKENFLAAVRLDPENAYAYYGLAATSAKLGLDDDAARYRQEFAERKQRDLQAERSRLETLDDVVEVRDSLVYAYMMAGQVLGHSGDLDRVESSWRTGAAIDPQAVTCRELLLALCQQQRRMPEALAWNEQLQRIVPENPLYHLSQGILLAEAEHLGAAEEAFRKVIELAPDRADGYSSLAHLFHSAGRNLAEARTLAQKAVDLAPIAMNYSVLSDACAAVGDPAAAIIAAGKAVELEPGNPNYVGQYRSLQEGMTP